VTYCAQAATVPLVINELLAANGGFSRDPQGQSDDWVEIYNAGSQMIDMAGMYLTDDLAVPGKWKVPTNAPQLTKVAAKGYLIIWLDGDTADSGLHASFALDSAGDQIALFGTDGRTLIDTVSFKSQRGNISYGRYPSGAEAWFFLSTPTPGGANAAAFQGVVADTKFSHARGFYDVPFEVTITCATPGVTILYTLDGSEPAPPAGRLTTGNVYSGPIRITRTTCLRARAVKNGWLSSNADTQTYIFLSDVITRTQGEVLARGYPDKWFGSYLADYEMDPQVCNDPAYAGLMEDALRAVPTLSLVTNKDNFFSQTNNAQTGGIYIYTGHSSTGGQRWERPLSVELLTPDGSREFRVDCGIRIQGGESRNPQKCPKHSLGLRFRSEYGPSRLEFPLFDGGPVESFDSLELRGFFNNAWTHWDPGQRQRTQYIRDQWMHDSLLDMGNADAGRGLYVHPWSSGPYLLYTRNTHWIPEKNRLLNDYFPRRTSIALDQFKSRGLYPGVNAPVFYIDGTYQHGGHVISRSTLSMPGTTGTVWYTLEGTDPRITAGGVSPTAVRYTSPVALSKSTRVKSRALSGATWSALNEAVFAVGPVAQGLRVSEIMYHPLDTGNPHDPNTEYVELTNIANQSINLNLARFTKGIDYAFPSFDLPVGGYCLVVKDIAAFQARYGFKRPVVGQYAGSLSNGGERIELVDAAGEIIQSFTFDDDWFGATDGLGFSLTVKAPQTTDANSLNEESAWRPSASREGSPGTGDGG
jgi:hypothetical protein